MRAIAIAMNALFLVITLPSYPVPPPIVLACLLGSTAVHLEVLHDEIRFEGEVSDLTILLSIAPHGQILGSYICLCGLPIWQVPHRKDGRYSGRITKNELALQLFTWYEGYRSRLLGPSRNWYQEKVDEEAGKREAALEAQLQGGRRDTHEALDTLDVLERELYAAELAAYPPFFKLEPLAASLSRSERIEQLVKRKDAVKGWLDSPAFLLCKPESRVPRPRRYISRASHGI
ncbi:hypothetical protein JCM10213v2_005340 [Rhodosporidiobolus nylandii]